MGMASKPVTSSIRAEPITAPSTPASSGWVESPRVKKSELKPELTAPVCSIRSSQASCSSLSRRCASGVSRLMSSLK